MATNGAQQRTMESRPFVYSTVSGYYIIVIVANISRHTIVGRAAKYSQYGSATDKCVLYRNQVNAVFTHL